MQQNNPSKGTFIALGVIVAATLALFFYYEGTPTDNSSSLVTVVTPESAGAEATSQRILSLLNEIQNLEINNSIFESAVFNSLVDYTIAIPEQNVGRANPFTPLGGTVKTR